MIRSSAKLRWLNTFPQKITLGEPIALSLAESSPFGALYPSAVIYKLFITLSTGEIIWVQEDCFSLIQFHDFDFLIPEEAGECIIHTPGRKFKIGAIMFDPIDGAMLFAESAALSDAIYLHSTRELLDVLVAPAHPQIPQPQHLAQKPLTFHNQSPVTPHSHAQQNNPKPSNGNDSDYEEDEILDEGEVQSIDNEGEILEMWKRVPQTFKEYQMYFGLKLKDIAEKFDVHEGVLSRGWRRACKMKYKRATPLPRWPVSLPVTFDLETGAKI